MYEYQGIYIYIYSQQQQKVGWWAFLEHFFFFLPLKIEIRINLKIFKLNKIHCLHVLQRHVSWRGAGANLIMFPLMWNSYLPDILFASHHHIQIAGTLIFFPNISFEHESVFFFFLSPACENSDKNGSIITLLGKNEYKFYWKTTPATMRGKHT